MDLVQIAEHLLDDMQSFLLKISKKDYVKPLEKLDGLSVGEHSAHLLEFYYSFFNQNSSGSVIDYNDRKNDPVLMQEPEAAIAYIEKIKNYLSGVQVNNRLKVKISYHLQDEENLDTIDTSFERELVFIIDHTIHHLMIINNGLKMLAPDLSLYQEKGDIPLFIKFSTGRM